VFNWEHPGSADTLYGRNLATSCRCDSVDFSAEREHLMQAHPKTTEGIVALFNASDDTIDMMQTLLNKTNTGQSLVWCHFADLKKGNVNFETFLAKHNPEVVIFDISPPYDENWTFFKTMRDSDAMRDRGAVLTTTNKNRLDEVLGSDTAALEVVGRSDDLQNIRMAIMTATATANAARTAMAGS
jgi:hypothetical protein